MPGLLEARIAGSLSLTGQVPWVLTAKATQTSSFSTPASAFHPKWAMSPHVSGCLRGDPVTSALLSMAPASPLPSRYCSYPALCLPRSPHLLQELGVPSPSLTPTTSKAYLFAD